MRQRFPDARVLVFAKAPVPGTAKTRLMPALGAEGAARLHRALVQHTVARLAAARIAPVELWCAPDAGHPLFADLARRFDVALGVQRGQDLGARMLHAATRTLTGAEAVVLIGTDCPDLGAGYLAQALSRLRDDPGTDAVLGPAEDGGYVLLALRRAAPDLFSDMPWGGATVASITRERMTDLGWRWHELPPLHDLDRPEDLKLLPKDLQTTEVTRQESGDQA